MDFRLFGQTQAWAAGQPVDIGHAKQRRVLAVLLLEAGQVVPTATLLDRVWGHEPPDGALGALYAYVARLRKALAPHEVRVVRRSGGYVAEVDPETVDVHRYRRLLTEARLDSTEVQAGPLDAALALWRDPPLADATEGWFGQVRDALREQRLRAVLTRHDMYVRDGAPGELLGVLTDLATAHPADERPVLRIMLALSLSGRHAEALAAYRSAYRRLAAHSGVGPSLELRELHRRILRTGLSPEAAAGEADASAVAVSLPRQLSAFVGRGAEIAYLDSIPGSGESAVVVVAGAPGVGKTALAVHWAHRAAERFPNGCLYAELNGYGPSIPSDPDRVLHHFLSLLGVAEARIPSAIETKAALYRSLLRHRRLIVLLDNAVDAQQVRPLLPAGPGCLVLVTSRNALTGLAARDRAQRLDLGLLPIGDAVELLAGFAGKERVEAEPMAARDLVIRCARLPVALCVAGERAASDPRRSLADLVAELADERRRLDILDSDGDASTAIRAVFAWSYQRLTPGCAQAFRLIGIHPGPDVERHAVAALTGAPTAEAIGMLEKLAHAHLVESVGPGRFKLHDLLRAYAAELALRDSSPAQRQAAHNRLFEHYRVAARAAADMLGMGAAPGTRHKAPLTVEVPPLHDETSARAWLDAQRPALVASIRHLVAAGHDETAAALAAISARAFVRTGHYADAAAVYGLACQAAQRTGDRRAHALALTGLGNVDRRAGRFVRAATRHRQALAIWRQVGDREGESATTGNLALVHYRLGEYTVAADLFRTVQAIFEDLGDRAGVARALGNIGIVAERQGQYEVAARCQRRVLVLARELRDLWLRASALANLGVVECRLGDWKRAARRLREALALCGRLGNRAGQAHALDNLGVVHRMYGRHELAAGHHRRAVAMFRELGDTSGEAEALNSLGETMLAARRPAEAEVHHAAALALARRISDRHELARAHAGLAAVHHLAGDLRLARRHWRRALAGYGRSGCPAADEARARLSGLR